MDHSQHHTDHSHHQQQEGEPKHLDEHSVSRDQHAKPDKHLDDHSMHDKHAGHHTEDFLKQFNPGKTPKF